MRLATKVLGTISIVMFCLVIAVWVVGCNPRHSDDPFEISYTGVDYAPATGGRDWGIHAGTQAGGVYYSYNEIRVRPDGPTVVTSWFSKLAGKREWHIGEVTDRSKQPLHSADEVDAVCSPSQHGLVLAPDWRRLGFRAFRFSSYGGSGVEVLVPCWFLLVLTGFLPVMWLRRRARERRRFQRRLCATCGYDLRGSPDRCPECGSIPVPASKETGLGGRVRDTLGES